MTANTDIDNTDSFYLAVPSNTPNPSGVLNKPQQFTVATQYTSQLKGKWEVALMEIQYPNTWYNVTERIDFRVYYHENERGLEKLMLEEGIDSKGKTVLPEEYLDIPAGYYESVEDIIDAFNKRASLITMMLDNDKINILYQPPRREHHPNWLLISPSGDGLSQMLGLKPEGRLQALPFRATRAANLTIHFPAMYLYCNFIDHQYVGNERAPLLRIIPIVARDRSYTTKEFQKPYYVPLSTGYINSMSFEIRDDTGEFVTFQAGKVILLLHFRPKRE